MSVGHSAYCVVLLLLGRFGLIVKVTQNCLSGSSWLVGSLEQKSWSISFGRFSLLNI